VYNSGQVNKQLGRPSHKRKTKEKCSLKEKGRQDIDWIRMACIKEPVASISLSLF